ncbi:type II secretion system protein [Candidatus Babeliales bacterium]|nr:type II secretion system protein [Candidatus Babeliales bacterium]
MILHKKKNKAGISFIEILVVLLLMSLIMSFAIPKFLSSQQGRAKKQFFAEFAILIADAMYQAVISKKIHQIFWDLDQHEILVKIYDQNSSEHDKHKKFKIINPDIFRNKIKFSENFLIHNFFIQGKDEMEAGVTKHTLWTYIMPDGTSQQILINIQDKHEDKNNQFSIKINPFYSQASLHDTFEKP